jgi:hypothetical protein
LTPQNTVWPQLLVICTRGHVSALAHVVAFDSGVQQVPLKQTCPEPQAFPQLPQLLTVLSWVVHPAVFGGVVSQLPSPGLQT